MLLDSVINKHQYQTVHSHVGAFKFSVFCKAQVPQTDKPSRTNPLPQVSTLQKGISIFLHSLVAYTKNLHDVILSFQYTSVVPTLSPASLAFRPEFADTPDALSENLHPSIVAELKPLSLLRFSFCTQFHIQSDAHHCVYG
jgi:hypothetical protein